MAQEMEKAQVTNPRTEQEKDREPVTVLVHSTIIFHMANFLLWAVTVTAMAEMAMAAAVTTGVMAQVTVLETVTAAVRAAMGMVPGTVMALTATAPRTEPATVPVTVIVSDNGFTAKQKTLLTC
jgi:hypothetical protein